MVLRQHVELFLGFDPGGKNAFGWSICKQTESGLEILNTGLATDALSAMNRVRSEIRTQYPTNNFRVRAAGIDAPLRWNNRGTRRADYTLRKALRETEFPKERVSGTVQAVNSLQGSCVVQGTLLARHLNEDTDWDLEITESHPTAFHHLLKRIGPSQLVQSAFSLTAGFRTCALARKRDAKRCDTCKPDSHRRDATLCVLAVWAAERKLSLRRGNWQNLYDYDQNDLMYPSQIPVSYWMPIPG